MNKKEVYSKVRAGAARANISPRAGTQLAGDVGWPRPAHSILDPLFARAVVFDSGERKLCLLGLDVTFIDREHSERIRAAAVEMGFAPEAVLVHATQTHSAPVIGHFLFEDDFPLPPEFDWLRTSGPDYSDRAVEQAVAAIRRASEMMRPVRIGSACAVRDGLAFNRRGVTRRGTVGMPWTYSDDARPLGPITYRYLEGPTDPEIGVLCARDEALEMAAMLLHFTCHPVNEFYYRGRGAHPRVSADWPGAWSAALQAVHGAACSPLILNGCCGNINPWPPFEPDFVPDHRRMGATLARLSDRIIRAIDFHPDAVLDWRRQTVPLPLREPDADRLAAARTTLERQPVPPMMEDQPGRVDWEWMQAAMLVNLDLRRRREPEMPYEIQVLRIGDTAIVGLPGEPFVEGQLQIKIESPAYPTFVAHACTHFAGYIPTANAFARGGHEVDLSSWSFLVPEALDRIVAAAGGMLRELFPAQ